MISINSTRDKVQRREASTPDLRIVATNKLVPHELHDQQRSDPLIEDLRQAGVLKNPPIVAAPQLPSGIFVVLDGANRALAMEKLGIEHTLVQVVPYESETVELQTWYHVISNLEPPDIEMRFRQVPDLHVEFATVQHAKAELARRSIVAYCLLPDGKAITLSGGGMDIRERTTFLHAIVNVYIRYGRLDRTNIDNLGELLKTYPQLSGAIIFPHYEPVEIMDLAESGLKVPPGLTRHIIHGRALRINYPLDKLKANLSLEEKNAELNEWVRASFEARQVRFYAESTYLFDE
jgi:L-serine kinase (ATP) / ParB family transcriptional regulator, heme-responsive regulator